MENNNKAVIYARVSSTTDRQSTERQVSDLETLAESRNMKIEKVYEEKISGAKKNSERAVLTECLEYCFSEDIGTLLISELSRLGRKTGYRKPEEDKRREYAGVLRLLGKGYPMKMIAGVEGVSVSTAQRLKKEFGL